MRACVLLGALALFGCSRAQPQLLVVIDTDLPVTGQALDDRRISPDATVDTLRIDVIDENLKTKEHFTAVAPAIDDWPVSFGVIREEGQTTARFRARLFRSIWSTTAELEGESVVEPFAELAVTRVLELEVPDDEVRVVKAVLRGDCMGVAPSFEKPFRTCVAKGQESELATSGIEIVSEAPARSDAGTWALAFEEPCPGAAPVTAGGAACIPGGLSVLGEPGLTNVSDGVLYDHDPTPARPVSNSPFYLDVREYTVGRYRAALAQNPALLADDEKATVRDPSSTYLRYCTFLGPNDDSNDALPLNCVSFVGSRKLCQAAGGDLPSEAQWEHAARGRGQRRRYAWGDTPASCCDATLGILFGECPGDGPNAGDGGPGCGVRRDESRDGILDMTGNLFERTLDSSEPYTADCWRKPGILADPVCQNDQVVAHVSRGGSWTVGLELGMLALRVTGLSPGQRDVGFRCAYPAKAGGSP